MNEASKPTPQTTLRLASQPLWIIGVMGGVASGKSQVAEMLGQLGATVIHADQLGHVVLGQSEVIAAARNRWGDNVVDSSGQLRRHEVARRVFGDAVKARENLEFWQRTTHPRIRQLMQQQLQRARQSAGTPAVVLDAALLLEAAWDEICHHVVFVAAPRDVRLSRAVRRGWTENDFVDRESSQLDIEDKRSRANIVIDNSRGLDETYEQVLRFWNSLHLPSVPVRAD